MHRVLIAPLLLCLAACSSPPLAEPAPPPENASRYPADFSLTVLLDAGERSRLYIIETDRTLRAARGAGVTLDTYPPRTARLTPDQMARTYELTRDTFIGRQTDVRLGHLAFTVSGPIGKPTQVTAEPEPPTGEREVHLQALADLLAHLDALARGRDATVPPTPAQDSE